MGQKMLMKGNEAIAEAAIQAGCRLLRLSHHPPESDTRIYVQAPAQDGGRLLPAGGERGRGHQYDLWRGRRRRTVHDQLLQPGHQSLKQEGISYIAGAELPCVIVNMVRGGPGLGSIQPAQSGLLSGHPRRRTRRLPHARALPPPPCRRLWN